MALQLQNIDAVAGSCSGKLLEEVALVLGLERGVEFGGGCWPGAGGIIPAGNHGTTSLLRQRAQLGPSGAKADTGGWGHSTEDLKAC